MPLQGIGSDNAAHQAHRLALCAAQKGSLRAADYRTWKSPMVGTVPGAVLVFGTLGD
jgi:hypothetical protein